MNDEFVMYTIDLFLQRQKDGKDEYLILRSTVLLNTLWKLYEKLSVVDVPKIESLTRDEKLMYWEIAKRYQTDHELIIKASKASYIISLIAN